MEVILGAGGVIANEIAQLLHDRNTKVRLVSRNPKKVNESDELFPANLMDGDQVLKAVQGCAIAYLTAGLPYDIKVWKSGWPNLIRNVIRACRQHNCKLVFFDNVYAYGLVKGPMKESESYNPDSKKGEVRAYVARELMKSVTAGEIEALIARSADFYGPGATLGLPNILTFQNIAKGKKAQILGNPDKLHSYTYTKDAALGTVMLAHDNSAYGQVWHLPTCAPAFTNRQFAEKVAAAFKVEPRFIVFKKWMVRIAGIFNQPMSEIPEMMYQNNYNYIFDSSKFEKKYSFKPTPYEEGIIATARSI